MTFNHLPVLLSETIEVLSPFDGGQYLDCTLGGGGHSKAILDASPKAQLTAIDRDSEAIQAATERLHSYAERITIIKSCYASFLEQTQMTFQGILMDVGVSSHQLDTASRGFSFQKDGPLDMRMNPESGLSASEWLDRIEEKELADVLFQFGEEPRSRRIAKAIIAGRPWHNTKSLAECIAKASGYKNSRTHPATRSFQAIRIAVNDELGQLERGLRAALDQLAPNGILAVITFHSLEDRLAKRILRSAAGYNTPKDIYGHPINKPYGKLVNRKGLSGAKHDPTNPRARSARLRAFQRSPSPSSSLIHLGV
jgi:16S rRNA (cytosine1402-N4)-methyltransferase